MQAQESQQQTTETSRSDINPKTGRPYNYKDSPEARRRRNDRNNKLINDASRRLFGECDSKGGPWRCLPQEARQQELAHQRTLSPYYKDNPETKRKNNLRRRTVAGQRIYVLPAEIVPAATIDPILARIRQENRAVLSEKDNSQTGTREGFIYVISNPAWPEWIKVGRALDYEDRTNSYQTASPFRDYVCHFSAYFPDRKTAEARVHEVLMWDSERRNREWFHVTVEKAVHCIQSVQQEHHNAGYEDRNSLRAPASPSSDET